MVLCAVVGKGWKESLKQLHDRVIAMTLVLHPASLLLANAKKLTSRDLKAFSKLISHRISRGPPCAYSEHTLCHFIHNMLSLMVHIQEMGGNL